MFRFFTAAPAILTLILATGCLSATTQEKDMLISKNKVYEKQNLLLERENAVLKTEAAQTLEALHSAEAHTEKVEADRKALQKKYDEDTALLKAKVSGLETESARFRKESIEKIASLTEQNRVTEKKLSDEIQRLSGEMKTLAENFSVERENLKKDFARRESAYAEKINKLEETSREKDKTIASLEGTVASIPARTPNSGDQTPSAKTDQAQKEPDAQKVKAGKDADKNAQK